MDVEVCVPWEAAKTLRALDTATVRRSNVDELAGIVTVRVNVRSWLPSRSQGEKCVQREDRAPATLDTLCAGLVAAAAADRIGDDIPQATFWNYYIVLALLESVRNLQNSPAGPGMALAASPAVMAQLIRLTCSLAERMSWCSRALYDHERSEARTGLVEAQTLGWGIGQANAFHEGVAECLRYARRSSKRRTAYPASPGISALNVCAAQPARAAVASCLSRLAARFLRLERRVRDHETALAASAAAPCPAFDSVPASAWQAAVPGVTWDDVGAPSWAVAGTVPASAVGVGLAGVLAASGRQEAAGAKGVALTLREVRRLEVSHPSEWAALPASVKAPSLAWVDLSRRLAAQMMWCLQKSCAADVMLASTVCSEELMDSLCLVLSDGTDHSAASGGKPLAREGVVASDAAASAAAATVSGATRRPVSRADARRKLEAALVITSMSKNSLGMLARSTGARSVSALRRWMAELRAMLVECLPFLQTVPTVGRLASLGSCSANTGSCGADSWRDGEAPHTGAGADSNFEAEQKELAAALLAADASAADRSIAGHEAAAVQGSGAAPGEVALAIKRLSPGQMDNLIDAFSTVMHVTDDNTAGCVAAGAAELATVCLQCIHSLCSVAIAELAGATGSTPAEDQASLLENIAESCLFVVSNTALLLEARPVLASHGGLHLVSGLVARWEERQSASISTASGTVEELLLPRSWGSEQRLVVMVGILAMLCNSTDTDDAPRLATVPQRVASMVVSMFGNVVEGTFVHMSAAELAATLWALAGVEQNRAALLQAGVVRHLLALVASAESTLESRIYGTRALARLGMHAIAPIAGGSSTAGGGSQKSEDIAGAVGWGSQEKADALVTLKEVRNAVMAEVQRAKALGGPSDIAEETDEDAAGRHGGESVELMRGVSYSASDVSSMAVASSPENDHDASSPDLEPSASMAASHASTASARGGRARGQFSAGSYALPKLRDAELAMLARQSQDFDTTSMELLRALDGAIFELGLEGESLAQRIEELTQEDARSEDLEQADTEQTPGSGAGGAAGALTRLVALTEPVTPGKRLSAPDADGCTHDVMISYSWRHKEVPRLVARLLRERGFTVWIDCDHMYGSLVDRMAEAVAGARLVMCFKSQAYVESDNCGRELRFADALKKPILGIRLEEYSRSSWLFFLLGTEKWVDMPRDLHRKGAEAKVAECIPEVLAELRHRRVVSRPHGVVHNRPPPIARPQQHAAASSSTPRALNVSAVASGSVAFGRVPGIPLPAAPSARSVLGGDSPLLGIPAPLSRLEAAHTRAALVALLEETGVDIPEGALPEEMNGRALQAALTMCAGSPGDSMGLLRDLLPGLPAATLLTLLWAANRAHQVAAET